MGIVLPLVGPLADAIGRGEHDYLVHCVGAAIGGATFGNICSPISDTTILSVLASKCDMQAHIATITPYALLAAVSALIFGSVPVGAGIYGPLTGLILGTGAMASMVKFMGK